MGSSENIMGGWGKVGTLNVACSSSLILSTTNLLAHLMHDNLSCILLPFIYAHSSHLSNGNQYLNMHAC